MNFQRNLRQPNPHMITTLRFIKKNPKLFDMDFFGKQVPQCGTVACFAGHASMLAGDRPLWEYEGPHDKNPTFDFVKPLESKYYFGKPVEVKVRAAELLELGDWEADNIFFETYQSFDELLADLSGDPYFFDFSDINWDE